ncbi:hypothetical protein Btru_017236 [Bulinus truncatus]|nr:hypothetical protein Btru_017236 [Bulinus truncatus]
MTTGLLSLIVLIGLGVTYGYINDYKKSFNYKCKPGKYLSYISSSRYYKDTFWDFQCREAAPSDIKEYFCIESDYVNQFDERFSYTCPNKYVLAGIESYYDKLSHDRKFKFSCCTVSSIPISGCYTTVYLIPYGRKVKLSVPDGHVIRSVFRDRENPYGDRRWRFEICKL